MYPSHSPFVTGVPLRLHPLPPPGKIRVLIFCYRCTPPPLVGGGGVERNQSAHLFFHWCTLQPSPPPSPPGNWSTHSFHWCKSPPRGVRVGAGVIIFSTGAPPPPPGKLDYSLFCGWCTPPPPSPPSTGETGGRCPSLPLSRRTPDRQALTALPRDRLIWGQRTRPGAGIAQSAVCWARCPAWCSIVGSTLL